MNVPSIKTLMEFNGFTIDKNLEEITHEESLRQPAGGGNCINWVLGHIVSNRNAALRLLGVEGTWNAERIERYRRGSNPVTGAGDAASWDEIRAADAASRKKLAQALHVASQEQLDAEMEDKRFGPTVGANLLTLQWHEGYHAGQLGVLRRAIGKAGALK